MEVDGQAETVAAAHDGEDAPAQDALVGKRLHHFRVESTLGRGGMGAVYRAFDESLERPVALKVLLRDTPELRERFLREARAQAKLRHPNVVPIHYVGEDDGIAFFVMDLVEGESLAGLLARKGPLPADRALDVVDAVACALSAGAEHGLIHRDVKPSNVLIDRSGHVLLADFGLAKRIGKGESPSVDEPVAPPPEPADGTLTRAGVVVGTPHYMAPEQATHGAELDHRADVYALGITLYEALSGQLPFTADRLSGVLEQQRSEAPLAPGLLVPGLRPDVERLVLRMIEKDPAARFETPEALRAAIREARARPALEGGSFLGRAGAWAIDGVVSAAPAVVVGASANGWVLLSMTLVLGLSEGRFGTTLAKRLFRLRTVGPHGAAPGYVRSMFRALMKLWGPFALEGWRLVLPKGDALSLLEAFTILAWFVGFLIATGSGGRALHDRVVRTRVVHSPRGA